MDYFHELTQTVNRALDEDIRTGDITASLIDPEKKAHARIVTRQPAVVCGRPWVDEVLRQVDATITPQWHIKDGDQVQAGALLLELTGKAKSLLTAERTALNFLQLLSGTATRTNTYVQMIEGTGATLLDTRKTIPGLRLAQKYAVKTGGAENHRIGLFDAFLIKENHIEAAGSITAAIETARQLQGDLRVEVEVENLEQLGEAIMATPDWIMLDNFTLGDMRKAVDIASNTGIKLEASGGIETSAELKKIASTGVDYISLGALTKHNEAIDLSMRLQ
ncbi:MAG: carboxylating nicotinate-nucleotide diphosphorylase [Gammaproteobacteria bacterium]|jgi:nicotinate-nucleotide pyrophosphorylase (carboxylating)|nr:carboxylating nicotinate-nucleotide diphosphorylase [Gammaproteobacteria bacterium]MBT3869781.1 carboxylating nicotinate-nucleotide diphosphorylase [Gammaproteobacteria bacterium]MBT4618341.1 carboxylating nicotinate-nucleotide diphosphorylase [Gammaproteobacteria bacterium]MBT6665722.1 carboxylating nicotinate-nucleotide diphosphorylase [Gammaproteobacteria bacterium]MBT6950942.1 carboxylating nicotinate-nucleotide diphosphorylase [Gammaproteobacteria bacterium]